MDSTARKRVRIGTVGARLAALAVAAAAAGGCASVTLPSFLPAAAPPQSSADPGPPTVQARAFETASMAGGTPADVYGLVARGALHCWLGPGGPLRGTHVFNGEAAPPDKGGAAMIVLHERDPSLGDQRGPRAFRIAFEQAGEGVRVAVGNLRIPVGLAEAMSRDAAVWAKGGTGCLARDDRYRPVTTGALGPKRTGSLVSGRR